MRFPTRITETFIAACVFYAVTASALPFFLIAASSTTTSKAADPIASPTGYTQPNSGAITVNLSTSTGGGNMRYTTNGIVPTYSTGTLIGSTTGSVSIPGHVDTVLQIIAYIPGVPSSVSNVIDEEYDFTNPF